MTLRRTIAAFVTFAFATLLCAPAFAGVWSVAAGEAKAGCCCSQEDENPRPSAHAEKCSCPACACTVGDGTPVAPVHAFADATVSTFAMTPDSPPTPADVALALTSRSVSINAARGPPGGGSPPLYILYDTLLI